MVLRGHIENGQIVFDPPVALPEGTQVNVEVLDAANDTRQPTLAETLLKHAGTMKGLPPDAALNHDHYLYGRPKK
jgi:hypothetical protein